MTREGLKQLLIDGQIKLSDIDEAYNDFEQRACKSCEYCEIDRKYNEYNCIVLEETFNDGFYCSKWASKK
jgi:hypothetical protein